MQPRLSPWGGSRSLLRLFSRSVGVGSRPSFAPFFSFFFFSPFARWPRSLPSSDGSRDRQALCRNLLCDRCCDAQSCAVGRVTSGTLPTRGVFKSCDQQQHILTLSSLARSCLLVFNPIIYLYILLFFSRGSRPAHYYVLLVTRLRPEASCLESVRRGCGPCLIFRRSRHSRCKRELGAHGSGPAVSLLLIIQIINI